MISTPTHPNKLLRPDFVIPALHLDCKPADSPNGSGILVNPHVLMPMSVRPGCPVKLFCTLLGTTFPQAAFQDLPILTGEELYEAAMMKKSTAAVLGWLGLE